MNLIYDSKKIFRYANLFLIILDLYSYYFAYFINDQAFYKNVSIIYKLFKISFHYLKFDKVRFKIVDEPISLYIGQTF